MRKPIFYVLEEVSVEHRKTLCLFQSCNFLFGGGGFDEIFKRAFLCRRGGQRG